MPIFTDPDVQSFVAQRTGYNPVAEISKLIPAMPGSQGVETPPIGSVPITYQLGQSASDALQSTSALRPIGNYLSGFGVDHNRQALMTALALGLGGAGFGAMTGRNPATTGLLGAAAGAGLGYGASRLAQYMDTSNIARRKDTLAKLEDQSTGPRAIAKLASAYYGMAEDPMQFIQSKVFGDSAIDSSSKAMLFEQLSALPQNQLFTLAGLLRAATGSAVGYLISRFLMNFGGTGQMLGAGIGGLLGLESGSSMPRNMYGDSINNQADVFGNRRLVN